MDHVGEGGAVTMRIEAPDEGGRLVAHQPDHALNRLQDARDSPERQGRCAEADDLAIRRRIPPADNLDRIGRRIRKVEALVQAIERSLYFERHVLRANTPLDLLDLGAGCGWMSYRLASRGHRPVAVDILTDGRSAWEL